MTGDFLGPVEFGGPDLPPRHLRNLLERYVDASPPGSRIDWATYYFRDRQLAEALIRASDRGVEVHLALEPSPRRPEANEAVIAMLANHGLRGGLHLYSRRRRKKEEGHLHAKIYVFSEPNIAWVGSFNPSGNDPEDEEVIAEIGDQDRGHNLLLGIERRTLTAALRRHVRRLGAIHLIPPKWRLSFNLPVSDGETRLYFYPRLQPCLVERAVRRLRGGDKVRGAISHLKAGELSTELERAAGRGVEVGLLVHDTERRVPSEVLAALQSRGVSVRRVSDPEGLPMHAKFLLLDRAGHRDAWLGSYNFNKRSQRHNAELLLRTRDAGVVAALDRRYEQIAAMAGKGP